jgi:hypothetical protein
MNLRTVMQIWPSVIGSLIISFAYAGTAIIIQLLAHRSLFFWTILNCGIEAIIVYCCICLTRGWLTKATFLPYVIITWLLCVPLRSVWLTFELGLEPETLQLWLEPQTYLNLITSIPENIIAIIVQAVLVGGSCVVADWAKEWSWQGDGGQIMKIDKSEITRLALASAVLLGSRFRRKVLAKARDKFHGVTPELGLDFKLLVQVCVWLERREAIYRLSFALIGAILAIGLSFKNLITVVIAASAALIISVFKQAQERFELLDRFNTDNFDPSSVSEAFPAEISGDLESGIPRDDQNVVVFREFQPFFGAGTNLGPSWLLSIDVTRPKAHLGSKTETRSFEVVELHAAVESAIRALKIDGLRMEDFIFVNGKDWHFLNSLLPHRSGRPVQHVDLEEMVKFISAADTNVRPYKWVQIFDQSNEFVVSQLFRFWLSSKTLFVEAHRFVLLPLDERYRRIWTLREFDFLEGAIWIVLALLKSPFLAVLSCLGFLGWLLSGMIGGLTVLSRERDISINPNYNFGSRFCIRQEMSGAQFLRYYQQMDKEFYDKTIERQVLDCLLDFLDSHNVDISSLRDRQSVILNNGVIVHGGDVKAKELAVGTGAKVSLYQRVLSKVGRKES